MLAHGPQRLLQELLALAALAGTVFAVAWLVRGGPSWFLSIVIEVSVLARAIALYVGAGRDTDEGALAGSRADERQQLVSLRSRALACNLTAITSFIGLTVAVAVKGTWGWPFLLTLLITGYGYLFGLGTYTIAEEGTPDDADTGRQARPPVSS